MVTKDRIIVELEETECMEEKLSRNTCRCASRLGWVLQESMQKSPQANGSFRSELKKFLKSVMNWFWLGLFLLRWQRNMDVVWIIILNLWLVGMGLGLMLISLLKRWESKVEWRSWLRLLTDLVKDMLKT